MSRQRLGQHFLKDPGWRTKILRALGVADDDVWLEIGAGHGEMTRELARTARGIVAIELDARLVPALERLAGELPRIRVVTGDVLKLDLAELAGAGRFKVYGNLPYYITSPILHRLFRFADAIAAIAVVVQLEVAARLVARPGRRDYGYLSVLAQFYAQPEIALRLPPGAFQPRPRVASALVRMHLPGRRATLGITDEAGFLAFIRGCFAQKRKTLLNNLRALLPPGRPEAALETSGIPPQTRAEQLSLEHFAALFKCIRGELRPSSRTSTPKEP